MGKIILSILSLLIICTVPLQGQVRTLNSTGPESDTSSVQQEKIPVYEVVIELSREQVNHGGLIGITMGRIQVAGMPLRQLIGLAFDISDKAVFGPDSLLDNHYDVRVKLPRGKPDLVRELMRDAIETKLGLSGNIVDREMDLFLLQAPDGVSRELYVSTAERGKYSSDSGVISGSYQSLARYLIPAISNQLNRIVLDDTGLSGFYDFQLYWDPEKPDSIIPALEEQLGLRLVPARRIHRAVVMSPVDR